MIWPDEDASADKSTHAVDIVAFVEAQEIPSHCFDTSYRLMPAPGGERLYTLLRETLKTARKVGIAYVVIDARQQLAALVPQGEALLLNTLRWAGEPAGRPARAPEASADPDLELTLPAQFGHDWPEREGDDHGDDAFCADIMTADLPDEEDEALDHALASALGRHLHARQGLTLQRPRGARRQRSGWLRPRYRLLS